MAQETVDITISVPVAAIEALCALNGYQAEVFEDNEETGERLLVANPVTPVAFAEAIFRRFFTDQVAAHVRRQERKKADERAEAALKNLTF